MVTIVTPSFNQAPFLGHTIQSVLRQDYEPVEYLVVDGGSKDNSLQVIQQYSDQLAWWVSEPDSGQAEAINKGLRRAQGEYVAWLNSDDLYLPGAVRRAVEAFEEDPQLGMVFGEALTIDAQGRPINRLTFGDWGLVELLGFRIICQPAVFMRRTILEAAGYLDPSYHFMLDHHLWIRMARLAPIAYFRHPTGKKSTDDGKPSLPIAAARHHPTAKNVAQATGFGEETLRLLDWVQTQPDLSPLICDNYRHIMAGAYRLQARYLLDGGQPRQALRSYLRALRNWPAYTLQHRHRMLYALLDMASGGGLLDRLRASPENRRRNRLVAELRELEMEIGEPERINTARSANRHRLVNWPGIWLETP